MEKEINMLVVSAMITANFNIGIIVNLGKISCQLNENIRQKMNNKEVYLRLGVVNKAKFDVFPDVLISSAIGSTRI